EPTEGAGETPLGDALQGAAQLVEVHRSLDQCGEHQATPRVCNSLEDAPPCQTLFSHVDPKSRHRSPRLRRAPLVASPRGSSVCFPICFRDPCIQVERLSSDRPVLFPNATAMPCNEW